VIEIVPFKVEHAIELMRGELTEYNLARSDEIAERDGEFYLSRGPCFSGVEDGKVLGSAGIMLMWPGVGEAWVLFSKDVVNIKKFVYTTITDYLITLVCDLDLRRVQAHCSSELPLAIKFLEQMGFEREGLMRKYGTDGSDHFLYAMVR
jgi:hypothetical protein